MVEARTYTYPAITPEEMYLLDEQRGREFAGPTPEEVLEWDEVDVLVTDFMENNSATVLAEELNAARERVRHLRYIWKKAGFSRPRGIENEIREQGEQ